MPVQIVFRFLSKYQIEQLGKMFSNHVITGIAREDESGDLLIRYRGDIGVVKTKIIPKRKKKK